MTKEVYENQLHVEVDSDPSNNWEIGEPGCVLETDGLGPCIGLILYDQVTQTGCIGHWFDTLNQIDNIQDMLKSFVDQTNVTALRAYIRGGAPTGCTDSEDIEYTEACRSSLIGVLHGLGLEDDQLNVRWLNNPHASARMQLATSSGLFSDSF